MWKRFENTSPVSGNITGPKPFRRNIDSFSIVIGSHLTKSMFGIDPRVGSPLQGFDNFFNSSPRALPWAVVGCPLGALELIANQEFFFSANGATHASLGQRPRNTAPELFQAPTGRHNR